MKVFHYSDTGYILLGEIIERRSGNAYGPALRNLLRYEDLGFDAALEHLHNGLTAVASSEDAAEGIAAFLEKRRPEWRGR